MNKPELYAKYSSSTKETKQILKEYFHYVRLSDNHENSVLDIGCGPGNVTRSILFPFLEDKVDKVVGIDISPNMVSYANTYNSNFKIQYREMDIAINNIPEELIDHFQCVFSFWTLHWIRDQRKVFTNILKMVKSDGNLLIAFTANNKLYDIYQTVWRRERWAPYIDNFYFGQSPFHFSEKPLEELREILNELGLETRVCELKTRRTIMPSFKELFTSIIPVLDQIPCHLQNDFIEDHVKELDIIDSKESGVQFYIDYNYFVVVGSKRL